MKNLESAAKQAIHALDMVYECELFLHPIKPPRGVSADEHEFDGARIESILSAVKSAADALRKAVSDDAIREAVLAEREAVIQACEDELFSEETTSFTKGYNGGIRNCLIVIRARGAA